MEYKFNGKQSHATRLEMLIALNYLLDNCTNEKKTSKTIELTKYAEEKFNGAYIDRRKANDIFDDLVEFTHKYPNIIPYTVIQVRGKPRYYVKKNILANKDIEKIASAIKDHGALTERASNQLIERFLDKITDEDKKREVLKTLKKTPSLVKHQISDENMVKIEQFEWLRDNQARFFFKLNRRPEREDVTSALPFRVPTGMTNNKKQKGMFPGFYDGYVFEVAQTNKSTKVCIYLPDYKSAVITNINNVILNENYDPIASLGEVSFDLVHCKLSLSDWFVAYFQGKGSSFFDQNVKFKFYVGLNNENLNNYKPKFEEFFKRPMDYVLQDRQVEINSLTGEKKMVVAQDAYVEVECCFNAFKKWYWESSAYESVVVLEPASWNDRLLGELVERFSKRLTKYGLMHNYELNRTIKPEYEQLLKERHERFMKRREEMQKIRENKNSRIYVKEN